MVPRQEATRTNSSTAPSQFVTLHNNLVEASLIRVSLCLTGEVSARYQREDLLGGSPTMVVDHLQSSESCTLRPHSQACRFCRVPVERVYFPISGSITCGNPTPHCHRYRGLASRQRAGSGVGCELAAAALRHRSRSNAPFWFTHQTCPSCHALRTPIMVLCLFGWVLTSAQCAGASGHACGASTSGHLRGTTVRESFGSSHP